MRRLRANWPELVLLLGVAWCAIRSWRAELRAATAALDDEIKRIDAVLDRIAEKDG